MRFEIACLLLLAVAAFAQSPAASSKADKNDAKFLTSLTFTTFTIAKSTTTTTSTFTSIVTCTTSTGTLSTCTAGRRRRGLFYTEGENRNRRGLFFNDEDEEKHEVFSNIQKRSNNPVDEVKPIKKAADEVVLPLEIQSGFSLPKEVPANRFLVAFGTSTVTTFTVTTSTTSLTAICSSTTGFPTCSSGK